VTDYQPVISECGRYYLILQTWFNWETGTWEKRYYKMPRASWWSWFSL